MPSLDTDDLTAALSAARLVNLPAQVSEMGGGLFILIDPMLGDPILHASLDTTTTPDALNDLRCDAWSRPTHSLRLPPGVNLQDHQAPYLVELTGSTDPWLHTSIEWAVHETVLSWTSPAEQASPHRIGGWLQSASFGAQLAEHMSAWLRLRTQIPTHARYLRLADRRVLGLTAHVIGSEVFARHLGRVQHWHWLDAHAAWRTLSATRAATNSDATFASFTADQWACMRQGEAVHEIIARNAAQKAQDCPDTPAVAWEAVSPIQWQTALSMSAAPSSDLIKQFAS